MTRHLLPTALLLAACASPATAPHGVQFKDADTFEHDGQTYRLPNWDGPESRLDRNPNDDKHTGAQCQEEKDLSVLATAYANELVDLADVVKVEPTGDDCNWGRLCADIRLDGRLYSLTMARSGYLQVWNYEAGQERPVWCDETE